MRTGPWGVGIRPPQVANLWLLLPLALMTGPLCQTSPSIPVEARVLSFSKTDCHARWGLHVGYNLQKDEGPFISTKISTAVFTDKIQTTNTGYRL